MTVETNARDGLVLGMDDAEYHGGPELSHTAMKWLLRSPKHYKAKAGKPFVKPEFDFGHAVHAKVLGTGLTAVAIPEELLDSRGYASTKAAKEFCETARANGEVPLKADVVKRVNDAAEAVLANSKARRLLAREGEPEVSLFATDPESGIRLRIRVDWLTAMKNGHPLPVDLKSTTDVRRHKIRRSVEDYGYDLQQATYRHVLNLITGQPIPPMQFVFVEADPPHEVRVVQLAHEDWIAGGDIKMRRAIETFARCTAAGVWPGDDDTDGPIESLTPRPYYLDDIEAEETTS